MLLTADSPNKSIFCFATAVRKLNPRYTSCADGSKQERELRGSKNEEKEEQEEEEGETMSIAWRYGNPAMFVVGFDPGMRAAGFCVVALYRFVTGNDFYRRLDCYRVIAGDVWDLTAKQTRCGRPLPQAEQYIINTRKRLNENAVLKEVRASGVPWAMVIENQIGGRRVASTNVVVNCQTAGVAAYLWAASHGAFVGEIVGKLLKLPTAGVAPIPGHKKSETVVRRFLQKLGDSHSREMIHVIDAKSAQFEKNGDMADAISLAIAWSQSTQRPKPWWKTGSNVF